MIGFAENGPPAWISMRACWCWMTSTIRREPVRTVSGQHHAEADGSLQEYRLLILSIFVSPELSNVKWQACAAEHSPALGWQAWFPLKSDFRKEISNHSFQLKLTINSVCFAGMQELRASGAWPCMAMMPWQEHCMHKGTRITIANQDNTLHLVLHLEHC